MAAAVAAPGGRLSLRTTQISEWFAVDDAGTFSRGAARVLCQWGDARSFRPPHVSVALD